MEAKQLAIITVKETEPFKAVLYFIKKGGLWGEKGTLYNWLEQIVDDKKDVRKEQQPTLPIDEHKSDIGSGLRLG